MKKLMKIGTMFLIAAMLCTVSVGGFAAKFTGTTPDHSKIQITSVDINRDDPNVWSVDVTYDVTGATDDSQITILGYIFDVNLDNPDPAQATDTNYGVEGDIRAIDQKSYKDTLTGDGKHVVNFKLAKGTGDYTIDGTEVMVVKFGSDVAGAPDGEKAQAFYFSLAPKTYTVTFEAGTYGENDTAVEGTMAPATASDAGKYTLPEHGFTVPEGYKFAGWAIKDAVANTPYKAGDQIDVTDDITLVAQWTQKPAVVYGDINGVGGVNMQDVSLVFQAAKKIVNLDADQTLAADVNGVGGVNMQDVSLVFQRAKKIIDKFPVED